MSQTKDYVSNFPFNYMYSINIKNDVDYTGFSHNCFSGIIYLLIVHGEGNRKLAVARITSF